MPTVYNEPHAYTQLNPIITVPLNILNLDYNVAYAPAHPALIPLMAKVRDAMEMTEEYVVFETVEELNWSLVQDQSRKLFAGVIFAGVDSQSPDLPNDLHAVIRFPAESRVVNGNPLTNNWQTDSLFPLFSTGGPRAHLDSTGGNPPGYYAEHFMSLQSAISQAFVELKAGVQEDSVLRGLFLTRFPEGIRTIDDLLFVMQLFVPLILFLGFLYPAINNVKVRSSFETPSK